MGEKREEGRAACSGTTRRAKHANYANNNTKNQFGTFSLQYGHAGHRIRPRTLDAGLSQRVLSPLTLLNIRKFSDPKTTPKTGDFGQSHKNVQGVDPVGRHEIEARLGHGEQIEGLLSTPNYEKVMKKNATLTTLNSWYLPFFRFSRCAKGSLSVTCEYLK